VICYNWFWKAAPFTASKKGESEEVMKTITGDGYAKEMISIWLADLQETGYGYDNGSDFDNEAELNAAMCAELRYSFWQSKDKYILTR
jgi:hypothetical protein